MRKVAFTGLAFLALAAVALVFSFLDPSHTARAYFALERAWNDHWPLETGKNWIQQLEPAMRRAGILRPVRLQVEPGVSFFLDPRDLVPVTILRTGEWQPEVWESLSPSLSPGAVFLDVGAHIGYFSMKAAVRVGAAGRVVSFEPNPETLKLLRDNVAANKDTNVIVEPIACTDSEQTLTLYAAPISNTGASSLARENASISVDQAPRPYTVRGRPIDDVVRELNLPRVDAVKIDVEGAEVMVLRGAAATLKRFHPKVVLEVVPAQLARFHTTPADVAAVLGAAGYNVSRPLSPEETDWEWTAQQPRSTVLMSDVSASSQLTRGFLALEQNSWRWTEKRFAVALHPPAGSSRTGAWLTLKLHIPEVSANQLKTITLSATVGDAVLAPETFTSSGNHDYRREVPASALANEVVEVDFSVDKSLDVGGVEHGVVVTSVGLTPRAL